MPADRFGSPPAIVVAGLAGGAAEIVWLLAYAIAFPVNTSAVAREVTASLVPDAADSFGAVGLGIGIHLALSVALAFAFVALLRQLPPRERSWASIVALAVATLVAVWALNFLVVLPLVNPRFITLLPYAATLFSKALFGATMGAVLARARAFSKTNK